MNLSESEAKIVAMFLIGVGSFLIGIFPACFTNRRTERTLLLSSLLCFGAGVLLATSLLHMLPETRESLPHYAELVFCSGFLLLYMVDEIVHFFWKTSIDASPTQLHSHQSGISHRHELAPSTRHAHSSATHGYSHLHTGLSNSYERDNPQNDFPVDNQVPFRCITRPLNGAIPNQISYEPNFKSGITCPQDPGHFRYGSISQAQLSVPISPAPRCEEEGTLLCQGTHTEPCASANTGLAGLLTALTLHAMLEGLAVGLQHETSKVLLLVGAIASHKLVVGFCLGIELASAVRSFLRHIIAIGVFAGGSSAGIGIGMMVTQVKDNWVSDILMPVLQGVAGGSLLYVTVSEVLPRERTRWHETTRRVAGITQFFSVTCGFFLMFILTKYTEAANAEANHGKD